MAKKPTTRALPLATQAAAPEVSNTLLIPVYSVEDAKAALQQRINVVNLMKRMGCTSVTFEIPSGRLAEIQETLGTYSNNIKLYYVKRTEQDGYILHRLPHYQPPAEKPAAVRERTRYVNSPAPEQDSGPVVSKIKRA